MTCTCNNPDVGFCNLHEGKGVSPEPTTAEAFDSLHCIVGHVQDDGERRVADAAVAVLQRRMLTMIAALRMVSEQGINSQWVENGRRRDMQREVRKALGSE